MAPATLIDAPYVLRGGRTREVLVRFPPIRLSVWHQVELIHARTGVVKQRFAFKNLVTNAGMNHIGSDTSGGLTDYFSHLAVGTGSVEPDFTDTSLGNEVGRTNNDSGFSDTNAARLSSGPDFEYWQLQRVRLFTEGEANGNLTELGYFPSAMSQTLMNRALFKNELGVPIVVTKTSEDQLRVFSYWRVYPPFDETVSVADITGVGSVECTSKAAAVHSGAWGAAPSGSAVQGLIWRLGQWTNGTHRAAFFHNPNTLLGVQDDTNEQTGIQGTLAAYDPDSFYRDVEYTIEPNQFNYSGGIGRMIALRNPGAGASQHALQMVFDPQIPKTNVQRLKFTARYSWARFEEEE